MTVTDDPVRDFERWDDQQEEWLLSRPICNACSEHIQDDYAYRINGNILCAKCVDNIFRFWIEDCYEKE